MDSARTSELAFAGRESMPVSSLAAT